MPSDPGTSRPDPRRTTRPEGVPSRPPDRSAAPLAALARLVDDDLPPHEYLSRVSLLAVESLPGADMVSVTLVRDGRPLTAASTSAVATALDLRQYEVGAGPCLDAARTGLVVRVDTADGTGVGTDLDRQGDVYPSFTASAARLGVRSCTGVGMPTTLHGGGSLNLYSRLRPLGDRPGATEDDRGAALDVASAFAVYAALAPTPAGSGAATSHLVEQLRRSLRSRAVIEQAKGVVAARLGVDHEAAFAHLVRLSQDSNTKLRDIAARVVGTVDGAG